MVAHYYQTEAGEYQVVTPEEARVLLDQGVEVFYGEVPEAADAAVDEAKEE